MRTTRRARAVGASAVVLATLAVVLDRFLLLLAGATVGAWLLTHQYVFMRRLGHLDDMLTVEQSLTPARIGTDGPGTISLSLTASGGSPLDIHAEGHRPVAGELIDETETTITLERGGTDASITFGVTVSVAGEHTVPQATLSIMDGRGLFTETIERGPTPSLLVEPRAPRNVHIGGSESVAGTYGEHDAGQLGSGLDFAGVREYLPGDEAKRIDWKVTARLNTPHVREFDAEIGRKTALLIDHRARTGLGRDGERAFDYLREVAIAYLESARRLNDPLGCYAVGDAGLTVAQSPAASSDAYSKTRETLNGLEPTEPSSGAETIGGPRYDSRTPAAARRAAEALANEDSPFATQLRPFFEAADPYIERVEGDPLFSVVQKRLARIRGPTWSVILTDDANRAELREAVKLARRGDDSVLVFIAPRVLYERGAFSDIEAAYDRYLDFEEFRRSIAAFESVEAFEVAPDERIGSLLEHRRRQRERSESPSGAGRQISEGEQASVDGGPTIGDRGAQHE